MWTPLWVFTASMHLTNKAAKCPDSGVASGISVAAGAPVCGAEFRDLWLHVSENRRRIERPSGLALDVLKQAIKLIQAWEEDIDATATPLAIEFYKLFATRKMVE